MLYLVCAVVDCDLILVETFGDIAKHGAGLLVGIRNAVVISKYGVQERLYRAFDPSNGVCKLPKG